MSNENESKSGNNLFDFNFSGSKFLGILLLIAFIVFLLVFFGKCDGSKDGNGGITKRSFKYTTENGFEMEVVEGAEDESIGIANGQKDSLYIARLLASDFVKKNDELRHQLTQLQIERTLWLDTARSFANRLELYFKTGKADSTLGAELYAFTAREKLKPDYSVAAQNLFLSRVDENEKLSDFEKEQLRDSIKILGAAKNKPNEEVLALRKENAELRKEGKRKDSAIASLAHDTAILAQDNRRLNGVAEANGRLADDYHDQLLDQPLVTISGEVFKPRGVATRSDGTYKVNDINPEQGLLLSFEFHYNVSLDKPTKDSVYVRYTLANKKDAAEDKYPVKEGVNQFIVRLPDDTYGSGLYVAEIFYPRDSSNIPNVHPDFTARKWSEKELSPDQ